MGQSQDEPLTTEVLYRNINKKLTLKDLKFYYIIGKGGFGNVILLHNRKRWFW